MKKIIFTSLILFFNIICLAQINKYGIPFIKNYTGKEFQASEQNWSIVQDKRGVIYAANNENGILEYDGVEWRVIPLPKPTVVQSLTVDTNGIVYVGAVEEIGYLAPNELGKMQYVSLVNKTDTSLFNTNREFYKIHSDNDFVYFSGVKGTFIFDIKKRIFASIKNPKGSFVSFLVNNKIFIGSYITGLSKIENNKIIDIESAKYYIDKDIFQILPFSNNELLIFSNPLGLSIFNTATGETKPFEFSDVAKKTNNILLDKFIYHGFNLDNNLAFATTGGGIFIINKKGEIISHLSDVNGLNDFKTAAIYCNKQSKSNIWAAFIKGISRIEYFSPIRKFGKESGLTGIVTDIKRFKNTLYVATSSGLFYLNNVNDYNNFTQIKEINSNVWNIATTNINNNEKMFISSDIGTYEIKDNKALSINNFEKCYVLKPSLKYKDILYISSGINLFKVKINEKSQQTVIKKFDNLKSELRSIAEDKSGNLWIASGTDGLIRIDTTYKIEFYKEESGLPVLDNIICYNFNNEVFFSTSKGLYTFDIKTNKIIPSNYLGNRLFNSNIGSYIIAQNNNEFWVHCVHNTTQWIEKVTRENDGNIEIDSIPFKRLPNMQIYAIFHDTNNISWIGGTEGLYSFDNTIKKDYNAKYYTLIRKITINEDSVLFHGTNYTKLKSQENNSTSETFRVQINQPEELKASINYFKGNIKITFAAPFFEEEQATKYSYMLEGYDDTWSKWSKQNYATYGNLFEGSYTFKVKALNIYGKESEIASYEFKILPPWYRTIYAYLGYLIALILFIWLIVYIATRRIKKLNVAYGRYLPGSFLKALEKKRVIDFRLGDQIEKEMTVMFSDIRSYTNLSESMHPKDNFRFLVRYLSLIGISLNKNDGFPVQYYGDGIMAMFPGDTDHAVQASIDMHKTVEDYSKERASKGRRELTIGVGMHTGSIIMGIRGDQWRWEGGIVGDAVNLASRMEGLTKIYGASTILSDDTYKKLKKPEKFNIRFLGKVKVKGKDIPVGLYELLDGTPKEVFDIKMKTKADFDNALKLYFEAKLDESLALFQKVASQNPNDVTACHYVELICKLKAEGIPDDFDGVEKMEKK